MSVTRIALNGGLDWLDYRPGSGNTVEILDIHVGSQRRAGVGKLMVRTLFNRLPVGTNVWAVTRAENVIAQEFYENLGFRVLGVLRSFYTEPKDLTLPTRTDAIVYGRPVGCLSIPGV